MDFLNQNMPTMRELIETSKKIRKIEISLFKIEKFIKEYSLTQKEIKKKRLKNMIIDEYKNTRNHLNCINC